MLYGMEDYGDYGFQRNKKSGFKKFFIIVLIILVIVIAGFLGYNFSSLKVNNEEIVATQDNKVNKKDEVEKSTHQALPKHDMEKIKTKFVPVANENASKIIRDIYFSDEKQVYLTFDDGPSKNITPQILDILKANDVKATFFVLGARVDLYPQTLKREFEEGHYIANHGYSHKYSQIYESRDTVFQEYVDCENSIKKALNNNDYNSYLFRFPGGSSGGVHEKVKAEARKLFNEYNVAFTNWNCLTGDAEGKNTREACFEEMINSKGDSNSVILLMHDANDKQQTVDVLQDVINYYRDEGYTFKTFYEVFK